MKTFVFASLCCALMLAGCSGNDGRVTVTGTVTLDGQPLSDGTITFVGSNGASAGVGSIDNGSFTISKTGNAEGMDPGSYKVQVESWEVQPGEPQDDGTFAEGKTRIPEKYNKAADSGLTAEVTADGGSFTFDLKTSGG